MKDDPPPSATNTTTTNSNTNVRPNQFIHNLHAYRPSIVTAAPFQQQRHAYIVNPSQFYPTTNVLYQFTAMSPQNDNLYSSQPFTTIPNTMVTTSDNSSSRAMNDTGKSDKDTVVIDISSDEGEDDIIMQTSRKKTPQPKLQTQLQAPVPPPFLQQQKNFKGGKTIDDPISLDDEEEVSQINESSRSEDPTSFVETKPSPQKLQAPVLPQQLSRPSPSLKDVQSLYQTKFRISKLGEISLQKDDTQHHQQQQQQQQQHIEHDEKQTSEREIVNKGIEEKVTTSIPSSSKILEPMDMDVDEDEGDDNDSISSSELVFGAAPIPTEIDRALLDEDFEVFMEKKDFSIKIPDDVMDMDTKTIEPSMKTRIPENTNLDELLSTIEVYDTSVIGALDLATEDAGSSSPTSMATIKMPRTSKRSSSKRLTKQASVYSEQSVQKPYVPWIVWQQVTWEDWAQLEVGDWLHWPFESWEITIIEDMMSSFHKKGKKRRMEELVIDPNIIWESIALKLPGRRAIDCSRFWEDKQNDHPQIYRHPVIISCQPWDTKRPTKYELIKKSRYHGKPRVNMNKMAIWSDLKCATSFGDGSADTLAVQILNKKGKWIKVIAASACNDQPEYNMPGNLRVWSAKNKRTVQLRGHRTSLKLSDGTEQDVWHTITDVRVSNDQKLIFTSSHDKFTKVWDSTNGKMLSTLAFHDKKVHQLAVCPDIREHIIASGSADGTAVIWKLSGSGKVGDGIVCAPDQKQTNNPSIDTLVFGRGPSKGLLYTGVSSGVTSPMGFIQGFDIQKGKSKIVYKNMEGAVCDIDVSETGSYIISGNHSPFDEYDGDGYVHINDTRTPELIIKAKTGHPDVNLVRMSPCERYVASGSPNNETIVLDIRKPNIPLFSLKHQQTLADHLVPINSDMGISGIHWMANSRILVTGGGDCSVKLWDIFGNGDLIKSYPTSSNVSSLAVDETAMMICAGVAGAQGIVHVWSAFPL